MLSFERLVAGPLYSRTGFPVYSAASGVEMLKRRVWVRELRVENPEAYPSRAFIDVASASTRLSLPRRIGGKIGASEVALNVRRLTGVRNRDGRVNFTHFREGLERREGPSRGKRPVQVERLIFALDTVEIIDCFNGVEDRRHYPVGFSGEWEDIELRDAAAAVFSAVAAAGLSREDAVFVSLLPEQLWGEILAR